MKFIAKEKPNHELELGDVIEYGAGNFLMRKMVANFPTHYRLINLETNEISRRAYDSLEEIVKEFEGNEQFRIIKNQNLEIREV